MREYLGQGLREINNAVDSPFYTTARCTQKAGVDASGCRTKKDRIDTRQA
jgi:hypothetical protein